uniref:Uncharacterized protein n=1 Tax=Megaselia scalaris TaxID=36166 RepID=T1GCS4_MEGSC
MTKKYEFKWVIPVPEELKDGCIFDRWFETKDIQDYEKDCTFKVDDMDSSYTGKAKKGRAMQSSYVKSVMFELVDYLR